MIILEYDLYVDMTEKQRKGSGESAALSMAICSEDDAAIASNNLRDVMDVVQEYGIELWTTAKVFNVAEQKGILSRERADDLWKKMKKTENDYLLKLIQSIYKLLNVAEKITHTGSLKLKYRLLVMKESSRKASFSCQYIHD